MIAPGLTLTVAGTQIAALLLDKFTEVFDEAAAVRYTEQGFVNGPVKDVAPHEILLKTGAARHAVGNCDKSIRIRKAAQRRFSNCLHKPVEYEPSFDNFAPDWRGAVTFSNKSNRAKISTMIHNAPPWQWCQEPHSFPLELI